MQQFQYLKPKTLEKALKLVDKYRMDAKILAGGTDVIVGLKSNAIRCKYVIDVKGIKELKGISYSDKEGLSIGGAVALNDMIECDKIKPSQQILIDAAKTLANVLIRNRATLIGNICNSSPGGDMLPVSLLLEAKVYVSSIDGNREIELKDFFTGVKRNVLKENEIVTKVLYPPIKGQGIFIKRSRIKGHDLSQISVAGYLKEDGSLKFSLGAVAPTPILVDDFENYKNRKIEGDIEKIADKVMSKINPISDVRATKEYRLAMARHLTCEIAKQLGGGK
ncbi:xanthine dehydrogenase family protein subunit M [Clostridiaceae bacterium UIB06]|uniref:Xanthine dehydrogenase family protein subunit M n=1 Tax=Clostridium thailandense TaxID=2794346 RepID=A0A949TUS5_9CLOT|nr:xanthine dehydrogenase family protein subunit M [Clostridium thailandense]MBV7271393.1 xanthine dehydrogenase family protein subunit M [Clostridium thailandense]MCH5136135.1 xanthine dehydrogenase family protein subunit M [Clostridiaceae bacterium UIB06]